MDCIFGDLVQIWDCPSYQNRLLLQAKRQQQSIAKKGQVKVVSVTRDC